jgi:hypothetical protein
MSTKVARDRAEKREIPPAVIITAIVILVPVMGAGGWYAYNGGWQTDAQKDYTARHEMAPLMAAKHGDMEPLQAENALRARQGQPPLILPKEKKSISPNNPAKLADLQRQMGAK